MKSRIKALNILSERRNAKMGASSSGNTLRDIGMHVLKGERERERERERKVGYEGEKELRKVR